ncbi:NAD(P)-binding protein [Trichoderma barbatum]
MASSKATTMLAVYGAHGDTENPLAGIKVGQVPLPKVPEGWLRVKIEAATVNWHDIFTLKGISMHPPVPFPIILGCEGVGTLEDGSRVIIYPVMISPGYIGDETKDAKRNVFSEIVDGTLAEYVAVPPANILPLPKEIDSVSGAVLGIAWLTAYRMLFTKSALRPGQTMLVQGSSGGVTTALIQLGVAAGMRVWATGRTAEKRKLAESLGAEKTFDAGETLPAQADAVFDTSGTVTWKHSIASVKAGGTVVVCGGHSGFELPTDAFRLLVDQISIHGVYAGTLDEFRDLISFVAAKKIKPCVGKTLPLTDGAEAIRLIHEGKTEGKTVLTVGDVAV